MTILLLSGEAMAASANVPDFQLFELVKQLLDEESRTARERRRDPRQAYDCIQLLAPFDGTQLPVQAEFRPVRCHDLSTRGFSFYTIERPLEPQAVIALGAVPFKFFVAEIRNIRLVEHKGLNQYLVGCEFVRRLA